MNSLSRFTRIPRFFKRFSEETRLCFGAGIGCLAIGGAGGLIHTGGSAGVALSAVKVIGCFYLFLGATRLLGKPVHVGRASETRTAEAPASGDRADSAKSSAKRSQSAA